MNQIRTAIPNDIDALVKLENACFTTDIISRKRFRELLQKKSIIILIAEHHQKIVGYIMIFFRKNSKKVRIYSLAVDRHYRHQGIAAALCQQAEKVSLKHHRETLILEVRPDNHPAIRFYKKLHYEVFATYSQFYEDGSDAIRMKKDLI